MINEFYDWWVAQVEAEADADTERAEPLDNKAYRRDFPEIDRWEDEGGSYVGWTPDELDQWWDNRSRTEQEAVVRQYYERNE